MKAKTFFRTTFFPLFLILVCPITVVLMWLTYTEYGGSVVSMLSEIDMGNFFQILPKPTVLACKILLIFAAIEGVLMIMLPGKTYTAPVTPSGNTIRYKDNGFLAWIITHLLLFIFAYELKWFPLTVVYDNFGSILTTCSVFSLLFCVFLYIKGIWFPSSNDINKSGNLIFDYYWGVELHPRIFGFDLKQFMICRLAMMGWSLIILSFMAKQYEIYGHVSNSMILAVVLQSIYILKFFWWETGYLATLDVIHDHFGFYICWGVITWLPCVYPSPILYLVEHPYDLSTPLFGGILLLGLLAIYINYNADNQRQRVRETQGNCTIWGKQPNLIVANYKTEDGNTRESLLLVSGWWGVSRHFNYIAEITLALCWTLPCLFSHILPYFYVTFLTILLVHRSFRDDERCHQKYGIFWEKYCAIVPYRLVPGLY